jgi:hypothetical protein
MGKGFMGVVIDVRDSFPPLFIQSLPLLSITDIRIMSWIVCDKHSSLSLYLSLNRQLTTYYLFI